MIPAVKDSKLLIGFDNSDDAAVYDIGGGRALVSTVDFFTPVVDDAVHFGKIAAANSLSDVYAMGGLPFLALNLISFPLGKIPLDYLREILSGASDKAAEAGVSIGGGHSIRDTELKFGMSVSGFVNKREIIDNSSARPGDLIVLTKKIGIGIITTAQKNTGKVKSSIIGEAIRSMEKLNDKARDAAVKFKVRAGTDVTGFGLLGHLHEISRSSRVDIVIESDKIPVFDGVEKLADKGFIPGGTYSNHEYLLDKVVFGKNVSEIKRLILCDAQTSGGLMLFCPESVAGSLVRSLKRSELCAEVIGYVAEGSKKSCKIFVK